MLLLFICAVIVGGAVPVQTAANTALRLKVGSPYLAALVNGSVGSALLLIPLLAYPQQLTLNWADLVAQPLWIWGAGVAAVFILLFTIPAMVHLGALGTALCMLTGSVAGGVIFDCTGWFRVPLHPFTVQKTIGLFLALAGFVLVLRLPRKLVMHQQALNKGQIPYALLALFAGFCQIFQSAVNSELTLHIGTSIAAGWLTMFSSAVFMLVILFIRRESLKKLVSLPLGKSSWILCGGVCGASCLIVNALLLKLIGAGTLVLLNIAGQLAMALFIDRFGWFGVQRKRVAGSQVIGLAIVFAGIAVIKSPF